MRRFVCAASLGTLFGTSQVAAGGAPIGSQPYVDHRNQPPILPLSGVVADQYQLGHAVFNTDFLAAGTTGVGRRSGLGPLSDALSPEEEAELWHDGEAAVARAAAAIEKR